VASPSSPSDQTFFVSNMSWKQTSRGILFFLKTSFEFSRRLGGRTVPFSLQSRFPFSFQRIESQEHGSFSCRASIRTSPPLFLSGFFFLTRGEGRPTLLLQEQSCTFSALLGYMRKKTATSLLLYLFPSPGQRCGRFLFSLKERGKEFLALRPFPPSSFETARRSFLLSK